jgi:hypothetical protein
MIDIGRRASRLILWVAILTAIMTAVFLVMAITTPPRSGPYCQAGCVGYPYTNVAAYVPRDYLWMYPAILVALLSIVLVQCIHHQTEPSRRVLSGVGVTLTAIGAGALIIDYATQLTFLQPALLLGETDGLTPWSQYNPHGVFIALENVGYLLLNIAFLFIGVAMVRTPAKLWRASGWVFVAGGALTLAALVLYAALYRANLEYRFEVAAIGLTWLVLIPAPVLLIISLLRGEPSGLPRAAPLEMASRS